jgi:hypothetical protein
MFYLKSAVIGVIAFFSPFEASATPPDSSGTPPVTVEVSGTFSPPLDGAVFDPELRPKAHGRSPLP